MPWPKLNACPTCGKKHSTHRVPKRCRGVERQPKRGKKVYIYIDNALEYIAGGLQDAADFLHVSYRSVSRMLTGRTVIDNTSCYYNRLPTNDDGARDEEDEDEVRHGAQV